MKRDFLQPPRRLLVIGAHPDDCEKVGGIALKLKSLGWAIKFLTMTNGAAGHHETPGAAMAQRRREEARRVAELTGFEYSILDFEDGRLTPGIPEREALMESIRGFSPDVIITHRPWDYHPDHRITSVLVQDCSYLLLVPGFLPLTPALSFTPAIFYMEDGFKKPCPFQPDLVLDVTAQADLKLLMFHQYDSQMYEWLPWIDGGLGDIPADDAQRLEWLAKSRFGTSGMRCAKRYREELSRRYGIAGENVRDAEALESCEYGRQLSEQELSDVFPF